ncbi:hypothetical protein F7890_21390 [Bordetella bronchiseptica]|nr:hypothetical protein F7D00_21390 [Bordetella bronchiseptica]KAB1569320.1 hypothetical protein F7890_21390 [Bordetella bronchiseptica]
MRVRRLGESGDLVTRGKMFLTDREAIAQTIVTRLKLFLGEYFRDVTDGTPWFQQVLGKFENLNAVEAVLRNRIARTQGVVRLLAFEMQYDLDTRALSVQARVLTTYGEQDILFTNATI